MRESQPDVIGFLLRNSVVNFFGFVVPLLTSLVTIPFVVTRLGTASFGVLALIWVVLGYFSLFDFGIGPATTKAVAEGIRNEGEDALPAIVGTSLALQGGLGLISGLALAMVTPILVSYLHIPPALASETTSAFFLLSLSLPFLIVSRALSSVLEGLQRFDLVNAVRIPFGLLGGAAPLTGVLLGWHLPGIVALQLCVSALGSISYVVMVMRTLPELGWHFVRIHRTSAMELASYGRWITVVGLLSGLLVNTDRLFIGALRSVAEVAFYSAPYSIVSKLWILPGTISMTVFPVFSSLGLKARDELESLAGRVLKYLFLVAVPIVLTFVIFGESVLRLWLGVEFAERSTWSLRILAFGFLVNSLSWVPSTLLQAVGRPDVVGKLFMVEVLPYLTVTWWLINRFGITGAAVSWALRSGLEFVLFFWACQRIIGLRFRFLLDNGLVAGVGGLGILLLIGLVVSLNAHAAEPGKLGAVTVMLITFAVFGWRFIFDEFERREVRGILERIGRKIRVG